MGTGVLAHRKPSQKITVGFQVSDGFELDLRVAGPYWDSGVDLPALANYTRVADSPAIKTGRLFFGTAH